VAVVPSHPTHTHSKLVVLLICYFTLGKFLTLPELTSSDYKMRAFGLGCGSCCRAAPACKHKALSSAFQYHKTKPCTKMRTAPQKWFLAIAGAGEGIPDSFENDN
jgi:hypothetical protein